MRAKVPTMHIIIVHLQVYSGAWRWAVPPTPEFCVGDTNMLVYFGVT